MTGNLPDPLLPAYVDLSDYTFMPIDVRRLLTSDTWTASSGDERAAALTLWLESWHQIPAGSLPDNERSLATLSGAGARWKKVRAMALRGWIRCSDGRLYHPVVVEKAKEAWKKKRNQSVKAKHAAEERWSREHRPGSAHGTASSMPGAIRGAVPGAMLQALPEAVPVAMLGDANMRVESRDLPSEDPPKPPIVEIFEHWNALPGLQRHKSMGGQQTDLRKALDHHSVEDIKLAISRYSQVVSQPGKYRELYSWSLGEFVRWKHGVNLVRFLSENWEEPFRPFVRGGAPAPHADTVGLYVPGNEPKPETRPPAPDEATAAGWTSILDSLRQRVDSRSFEDFFEVLVPLANSGGVWRVWAPNDTFRSMILENFGKILGDVVGELRIETGKVA